MSEKRRDNKGRLLRQGELQRSDGKYEYRYYDEKGERKSVYSWKLVDRIGSHPVRDATNHCAQWRNGFAEISKMEYIHMKRIERL